MWFPLDRPQRSGRRRHRPSHATFVAYLALIVAVVGGGGMAVAAGLIHTRDIADGAVTNPKIANNAVGNAKIRENAVGPARLMNGAVTNPKLRNDSVGTVKIRTDGVHRRNIRDGAVNSAKIENHGVHHDNIAHNAVSGANLQNDSVHNANIADGAVNGAKVARNSLTGRNIRESTLRLTRVRHVVTGGEFSGLATDDFNNIPYPLDANAAYTQPAHSVEAFAGHVTVTFPDGCAGVQQNFNIEIFENGNSVTSASFAAAEPDTVAGTQDLPLQATSGIPPFFPAADTPRTITARVWGVCGSQVAFPIVDSLQLRVFRTQ